jgi:hypothetical protein
LNLMGSYICLFSRPGYGKMFGDGMYACWGLGRGMLSYGAFHCVVRLPMMNSIGRLFELVFGCMTGG